MNSAVVFMYKIQFQLVRLSFRTPVRFFSIEIPKSV